MSIHGREDNARWDVQAAPDRGAAWGAGAGSSQGGAPNDGGTATPANALSGVDCRVSIQNNTLVIERSGRLGKLAGGSRSIPLSAVFGAEFKAAGTFMPGNIAVQVNPPTHGFQKNDIAPIVFNASEQSGFVELHAFLLHVAEQNQQIAASPAAYQLPTAPAAPTALPGDDLAPRLAKLEALRSAGLITDDEFTQRREQILDSI